jgi:hypothetical protein
MERAVIAAKRIRKVLSWFPEFCGDPVTVFSEPYLG